MKISMKSSKNKIAIIITAAGSSTRIGGGIKKEYLPFKNGTVLSTCVQTFINSCKNQFSITDFIVTCPPNGILECQKALSFTSQQENDNFKNISQVFQIVEGDTTRQKSVYNAMCAIRNNPQIVLIHDGARPFVSQRIILEGIEAAQIFGASVPGLTPTDTQKQVDKDGFITKHLQRASLVSVQTPQCFDFPKLLNAHKKAHLEENEYTDDTEIWGKYYGKVKVTHGENQNIKITYPKDLESLK